MVHLVAALVFLLLAAVVVAAVCIAESRFLKGQLGTAWAIRDSYGKLVEGLRSTIAKLEADVASLEGELDAVNGEADGLADATLDACGERDELADRLEYALLAMEVLRDDIDEVLDDLRDDDDDECDIDCCPACCECLDEEDDPDDEPICIARNGCCR